MNFAALQPKQSTRGQRHERRSRRPFVEELEPRNLLAGAAVYYNPIQMATAYGFGTATSGAGQTIAIVDAYGDPTLLSDVATFNQHANDAYGTWKGGPAVPAFNPNQLTVVNQTGGTTLPKGSSWSLEIALDVEWAHAMAPGANILLVEATSNSFADLFAAVTYAATPTSTGGGGASVVSMSWGSNEFGPTKASRGSPASPGETGYDAVFSAFAGTGVTFVASSGDSGVPSYPAVSPNVLGVGGTILNATYSSGAYVSETGWSGSGGGVSKYELVPSYQSDYAGLVTTTNKASTKYRNSPDVAFDSGGTNSYVWVFSGGQWYGVYGTSAGAPQWAALISRADDIESAVLGQHSSLDSTQTLPAVYSLAPTDFHDITSGKNAGYTTGKGYDLVTGLGTPNSADALISGLASYGELSPLVNGVSSPGPGGSGAGGDVALATAMTGVGATAMAVNHFFVAGPAGQAGTFSPANLVLPATQQVQPPSFVTRNFLAPSSSPTPTRQLGETMESTAGDNGAAPLLRQVRQPNNVQPSTRTTPWDTDQSQWLPTLDAVFGQDMDTAESSLAVPVGAVESQVEENALVSAMALVGATLAVGMNRGSPTDRWTDDGRRRWVVR